MSTVDVLARLAGTTGITLLVFSCIRPYFTLSDETTLQVEESAVFPFKVGVTLTLTAIALKVVF